MVELLDFDLMNGLIRGALAAYSAWPSGVVHRMNHILRVGPGLEMARF
ncbi:hypothetical protein [Bordetella genomosp. 1]|nr:hypothetical protein [Bordetella genomosp. 1]MDQ8033816.1 hypothetical protein [Bordetella sp.]